MLCCIKSKETPPKDTSKSSPSKEKLVQGNNNSPAKQQAPTAPQVNQGFEGKSSNQGKSASVKHKDIRLDQVVLIEHSAPQDNELDPKMAADLSGLISRLEAVTSRLESATASGGGGGGSASRTGQPGNHGNICTIDFLQSFTVVPSVLRKLTHIVKS